jgi:hypothetical protein
MVIYLLNITFIKQNLIMYMWRILIINLFILFNFSLLSYAQTEIKDVIITASGIGKNLEDASQSALRSVTEQAFSAFISSNTEILNDHFVADQITSLSNGNIKSYQIVNNTQLPDGRWSITLKAIVSVDKLISFVQAKGFSIEIKGGLFALNIKQQLLNEQSEIKAVTEMIGLLHEPMQISFDYIIKNSDPLSIDVESKNWEISLFVTAKCNKNIDFCANYLINILRAVSLSAGEVRTYLSLNKQVFPVKINYAGKVYVYNLRKKTSINAINSLISNFEFYMRLFSVQSGKDESIGKWKGQIHDFQGGGRNYYGNNSDTISISFPSAGQFAGTFSWTDKRTLTQIEQMTGYSVKPRGVVSKFKNGGYLVYEKDGHGLVVAICDIGAFKLTDAQKVCDELVLNGYSDWHLPSTDEIKMIYDTCKIKEMFNCFCFQPLYYWCKSSAFYTSYFDFKDGRFDIKSNNDNHFTCNVRAVRVF